MSSKRESPKRITLAMMKGKPIATSVPAIRYHASDDELEELYPSTDEEKRATPEVDKCSPKIPSSPAKVVDKKVTASSEDGTEETRPDSSLQEGTPPSSDPWKVFSEIKGKITKTFEEKLCEMKSDKRRKSRSPKENSSISDSEDLGDITPSDENSTEKQRQTPKESTSRRRGLSSHYVGFSRVKTGLKDKTSRDECVESGVEAAEFSEDVYEGVVFGLDSEISKDSQEKLSTVTAAATSVQNTNTIRAPVQILPVASPSTTKLETIYSRLADQLIYPLAYRSAAFFTLAVCFYYFTPLPESILGFMVGVFATVTFFNALATVSRILTSLPEEKPMASQTVPVLEIPAVEEHAVVERFEGWLNELPYPYDPDDYHVARTKSVFFRLEGDILRIMETRIKIPKRAIWDEQKHKLKFTKRRAYCLAGAEVELLPQGLIRRRRWSKKYPICITLKQDALISNVTLKRSIKSGTQSHAEANYRRAVRKRKNLRRRFINDKENDEGKRDSKAKQMEEEDRSPEGLIETVYNERKEKRKDFSDISETTENSFPEENEDDEDDDDDTLDGQEFDEELEEDEDEGDYEDEEEEDDDDLEWDADLNAANENEHEDVWLDEKKQRSPLRQHVPKERKHSDRSFEESTEGYEDAKEFEEEKELFKDADEKGRSPTKDVKENEKEDSRKFLPVIEDSNDVKEHVRGFRKGLRMKSSKVFRDTPDGDGVAQEIKLFIFARADRQKEDWYRRLVSAASWKSRKLKRPGTPNDTNSESKQFPANHATETSSELSFNAYMAKYLESRTASSPEAPSSTITEDVVWFNSLVARILFDMHKCPEPINLIQDKIQRKLSNIKLPYFMESLLVSEIVIGQGAPVIRSISKPITDERGFWLDVDIVYKGSVTMTVETKLNLMKLTRTGSLSNNTTGDLISSEKSKLITRSPIFDSDVEDTPETSTEEEESGKMRVCGPTKETQPHSSGRKFLSMVDKIAANKYFQHATEFSYVRKAMKGVSNTEIRLMVTISGIEGCLSVNVPPAPSDRLWYGFKPVPKVSLTVKPAVGERAVNIVYVTKWIEAKLLREFEKLVVLPNMDDLLLPLCPNYPYMANSAHYS